MKKLILITGASSGMGVDFARFLAEESADFEKFRSDELWIIARRKDRLQEVKARIEAEALGKKKVYPEIKILDVDVSGKEGAFRIRDFLKQQNELAETEGKGGIEVSVLVNNAGFGTYGEFAETSVTRQMDMIDLDCTSLTGITGFALPYIHKGGRIINTASLASYSPLGNFAVYAACKSYVLFFTTALRSELKHKGIKVTALCPGSVSTEFANVASNGARKEVLHGLSSEKTVMDAVKKSRKGKLISMKFFKWKLKAFASKLVTPQFAADMTYKYSKRPSNPFES